MHCYPGCHFNSGFLNPDTTQPTLSAESPFPPG